MITPFSLQSTEAGRSEATSRLAADASDHDNGMFRVHDEECDADTSEDDNGVFVVKKVTTRVTMMEVVMWHVKTLPCPPEDCGVLT